jgi:uncharacterized protein YecE (DUF72 family)
VEPFTLTKRMAVLMGKILIGTASWTDKTLLASGFYPKGVNTPEARLRHYSEQFPIVEVDATYYAPPTERNAALWATRTPKHFTFHVKAYSLLTQHPTRPKGFPQDLFEALPAEQKQKRFLYADRLLPKVVGEVWNRFADALMPLHSAGKLGVVHFQYPKWFFPSRESRDYILDCQERLKDYRIAVEFRSATWMNEKNRERTLEFLSEHQIPYTSVDMPQGFQSSLPPIAVATAPDLAYVRFHGRNAEQWEKKHETATPRFAYLYEQKELEEWIPKLKELSTQVKEVHVLMNNCYRDYAVVNARQLADML